MSAAALEVWELIEGDPTRVGAYTDPEQAAKRLRKCSGGGGLAQDGKLLRLHPATPARLKSALTDAIASTPPAEVEGGRRPCPCLNMLPG